MARGKLPCSEQLLDNGNSVRDTAGKQQLQVHARGNNCRYSDDLL